MRSSKLSGSIEDASGGNFRHLLPAKLLRDQSCALTKVAQGKTLEQFRDDLGELLARLHQPSVESRDDLGGSRFRADKRHRPGRHGFEHYIAETVACRGENQRMCPAEKVWNVDVEGERRGDRETPGPGTHRPPDDCRDGSSMQSVCESSKDVHALPERENTDERHRQIVVVMEGSEAIAVDTRVGVNDPLGSDSALNQLARDRQALSTNEVAGLELALQSSCFAKSHEPAAPSGSMRRGVYGPHHAARVVGGLMKHLDPRAAEWHEARHRVHQVPIARHLPQHGLPSDCARKARPAPQRAIRCQLCERSGPIRWPNIRTGDALGLQSAEHAGAGASLAPPSGSRGRDHEGAGEIRSSASNDHSG